MWYVTKSQICHGEHVQKAGQGVVAVQVIWVEKALRGKSLLRLISGVTVHPSHPQYLGVILAVHPTGPCA